MSTIIWYISTASAVLVAIYVVARYFVVMDGLNTGLVKAKLMYVSKLSAFWYSMLYIHIATSIIALVIGPLTLSTKLREKNIKLHRILGRIYIIGIILGGVSGLYLAFYAMGE